MLKQLCVGACCILASSCASAPDSTALPPPGNPMSFSSSLIGMEPGIDEPEPTATWRPGDAVAYGVTMKSPRESRQWLVKIEVHSHPGVAELAEDPPFKAAPSQPEQDPAAPGSEPVLLRVEIFDRKGISEHVRHVLVPAADLEHGLYPGCRAGRRIEVTDIDQWNEGFGAVLRSMGALDAFLQLGSPALKPILDTVVARPSLIQIVLHGGVLHLGIYPGFSSATAADRELAIGTDPVDALPIEVTAYGEPALAGRMFVTESRPPFLPVGGIVGMDAWHPEDAASTVSVRLLSARRGRP